MKIAIDISPLQSGHNVRGVGFYLEYLKRSLLKYYPENEYIFFTDLNKVNAQIDLVHYPYFDPFSLSFPLINKYKSIYTVHDLTPLLFPQHFPIGIKGWLRWQIQKTKLLRADGIVTDSYASQKDILKITGLKESKISVAYLAAADEFRIMDKNDSNMLKVSKKYNLPNKFLLYVGDVTWNKNLPLLINVVNKNKLPLIMVGKALLQNDYDKSNIWNHDLKKVQDLIKGNNEIKILGFIPTEDLVAIYNMASVFVWPSIYEGFGLPVIEAMQSGCPVIVSRESCMPEVAGEAGYYFDGYDENSLSNAVNTVFNSDKLQKQLSKSSIIQAKKFSWQQTAADTIKMYNKILSTNNL